ncbi:MAG: hypothetical protein ACRC7I_05570 [Selenomonadaceae bacterium]
MAETGMVNPVGMLFLKMGLFFLVVIVLGYLRIRQVDARREVKAVTGSIPLPQTAETNHAEEIDGKTLAALLTTAIMAYGYKDVKIKSIRKIGEA